MTILSWVGVYVSNLFRNIALLLIICAVVFSISFPLVLLTDQAPLFNKLFTSLLIMFPLIIASGLFYGLAIIIKILSDIASKV